MPGRYFLVFLTFSAFRNSFHGALPPTIGQSFLQAGSPLMQMALPQQPSGPIVGSATMMVTYPLPPAYSPPQPTSSSPPAPAPPPSWARSFWLGRGGAPERGVTSPPLSPSLPTLPAASVSSLSPHCPPPPSWPLWQDGPALLSFSILFSPPSPSSVCVWFLPCCSKLKRESCSKRK